MNARFANRPDAGAQLARRLAPLTSRPDVVVLGIVPGGMVIAAEVARRLDLPLAAFIPSPMTPADLDLRDKIVIVVDDIAATGYTLVTAVRALRLLGPAQVIAATPMISAVAATQIAALADRCVSVSIAPEPCTPERGYLEFPALTAEWNPQSCCCLTPA